MAEELAGAPASPNMLRTPGRQGVDIATRLARLWHGNQPALVAGAFLCLVVLGALFAPVLSPHSPTQPQIRERLKPPSLAHPMGTDELGRDILTRILYGGRPILVVGLASTAVAALVGTGVGLLAAYRGGWADELLMRLMDIVLSFPAILLAILIVAALGAGIVNLVAAIAAAMIPLFARLARALALQIGAQEYVMAARTLGLPASAIIGRHVLPNILPPLLVQTTAMLAVAFATSSALNFVGLGVAPPTPDWGLMVAEGQRLVFDAPHVSFFPGLVIALTVLAVNVIGDGLRDALDPMLRNR
jgi:peptide/nickel transport system permease protein